jgi:ureidoglycolate hydrolase
VVLHSEYPEALTFENFCQLAQLIAKLKETFDDLVTIRHTLSEGGAEPKTVSSEADFDAFCALVQRKEEEEAQVSLPSTSSAATAGKLARHKAVAVTTEPFKGGAKLLKSMSDPDKIASMLQLRELSIANPQELEVTVKGVVCKADVPVNICDGRWHHLALTWRSKGGCLALHVDGNTRIDKAGVGAGEQLLPNGCLIFGQAQNSIGRDFAPGGGFEGHIAHIGLFKFALPLPRVLRCLSAPLQGDEEGLVLLWDFVKDPLAGDVIPNSSTYGPPSSSPTNSSAATGAIRDKASLGWVDATLPGDARICGLGCSMDATDAVTVTVTCSKISEQLLADKAFTSFFLHVVIGEEGNDQEHAMRYGSLSFAKASYEKARHVQVMRVDAMGHRRQREALEKHLNDTSQDRELLMFVQLCRETYNKAGDMLSEVVARAKIDLLKYLGEGRDEVGKELSVFRTGQAAGFL